VEFADMTTETSERNEEEKRRLRQLDNRLDAMSWGTFFMWVGVTLLFDVASGIGLLGIATIVLGTQAIGSKMGLRVEGFWIAVGICFLVGGIWEQFAITLPLVPLLLIGLGIIVFLTGGRKARRAGWSGASSGLNKKASSFLGEKDS